MSDTKDYYAILGVLPSIEQAALSAVYRTLIKKYHPDVYSGSKADSEKVTRELNEAYGVLGDEKKRADYDKVRETDGSGSGDYEQESYNTKANKDALGEKIENWDYATEFYPDAEKYRANLNKFSPHLALTYQVIVLEEKAFHSAAEFAEVLEREFLNRYFGDNLEIHSYVKRALNEGRRDVALEVNKAIKILGSPARGKENSILSVIERKYDFKRWDATSFLG